MTKRKTPHGPEWQIGDRCRACQVTAMLTFRRPEYGMPTTLKFNCPQCESQFIYIFVRKRIVAPDGSELPLTLRVRVVNITDEGLEAYQKWKRGELKPGGLIDNLQPDASSKELLHLAANPVDSSLPPK